MKAAIVVPVRNERAGLEKLVENLLGQMAPDDELIFVDAGSTDGTREYLLACAEANERIRLLEENGATCGGGRNEGIGRTDAPIIIHIDGGNVPQEGWLSKLRAPLEENRADYVTGNIAFMPIPRVIFGIEMDMGEIYGVSLFRDFRRDDGEMAGGSSVAYLRWVWEMAGGLPDWCRAGGEDVLFVRKVEKLRPQARQLFVKDAVVSWQIGPGLADVLKRKLRFQADLFLLYEGVPGLLRGCLVPFILLLVAASALFSRDMVLPASLLFVLEWTRQGVKVNRVFLRGKRRAHTPKRSLLISVGYLFLLEGLNLLGRMAGLVIGSARFRESRVFRKKARKYLSKAPRRQGSDA